MRFYDVPRAACLSLAVAMLAAAPATAKTISVSATTPDANEKLQEALILAEPGDVVPRRGGRHQLDAAAGGRERHRPETIGTRPIGGRVELRHKDVFR